MELKHIVPNFVSNWPSLQKKKYLSFGPVLKKSISRVRKDIFPNGIDKFGTLRTKSFREQIYPLQSILFCGSISLVQESF